ncbi:hypothetical protein OC845_001368 [Tilletia horrida]|nr:hypothetical protein OC845_001368 [Tilletia horrida]
MLSGSCDAWYGGSDQFDSFNAYIQKVHNKWPNLPIWITEMGVTRTGAGSQFQALNFHCDFMYFVDSSRHVKRVAANETRSPI